MTEYQEPEKFQIETDPPAPDFATRAKVIREIKSLGYDDATAARFARLIGNKPIIDAEGCILVMEQDKVLAKLKLTFFSGESRDKAP